MHVGLQVTRVTFRNKKIRSPFSVENGTDDGQTGSPFPTEIISSPPPLAAPFVQSPPSLIGELADVSTLRHMGVRGACRNVGRFRR